MKQKKSTALLDLGRQRLVSAADTCNAHDFQMYQFGFEYVGPLLSAYAGSVRRWSIADKTTRLYCLSRDGQIIKEVFDAFSSAGWNLPPRTYAFTSRRALRNAEFAIRGVVPAWIYDEIESMTLAALLDCLTLGFIDSAHSLELFGLYRADLGKSANSEKVRQWMASAEFKKLYFRASEQSLTITLEYFETLGLFHEKAPVLCDVGWIGSLQSSLEGILEQNENAPQIKSYLVGFKGAENNRSSIRSFLGPHDELCRTYCFAEILELFLSADHGGVTGYSKSSGEPVAVLTEETNTTAMSWGIMELRRGVMDFVNCVSQTYGVPDDNEVEDLFHSRGEWARMLKHPTGPEAKVIGSWPMSRSVSHADERPLAPRCGYFSATYVGLFSSICHQTIWQPGISKGSGEGVLLVLRAGMWLRRRFERLIKTTKV